MAAQMYGTKAPRIGRLKGAILKHAMPTEVLSITGKQHKMPKNSSNTLVFRRWLPYGATATNSSTINTISVDPNAHLTQEGVTPDAETITPQDITVQLNQYSCLYMYTDVLDELYEDNVPDEMKTQVGERMGLVREMIRYGTLKGCTNKFYAGGTSRGTVDLPVHLDLLRNITRTLRRNRSKQITRILSSSPNYNTAAVEAGYLVFCHTDCEQDIRDLPGFTKVADYGQRSPIHPMELGTCENMRFIVSPELAEIADAGAAIGITGLKSTTGSLIDVFPLIVVADDAWGDVALRGMESFKVKHLPPGQEDKSDPLGQRGYVGAIFYSAAVIQNDGWMAVAEVGVTAYS